MSEAELKDIVVNLARTYGYLIHHDLPAMNMRGRWATHVQGDIGFPDLILLHPKGGMLVIELKSSKGKVTPAQKRWLSSFDRAGIATHVVRPEDLSFVSRILEMSRYK